MMPDGDLLDPGTSPMSQHRHEPVQSVERGEKWQDLTPEHPEIASGILEIDLQGPAPGRAGDARGCPPHKIIHPLGPHAADQVTIGQCLHHLGKVRRVILAIPIQSAEDRAPGMPEAGEKGCALAFVRLMAQSANSGILLPELTDLLPGPIRAVVVHEQDLKASAALG